MMLFALFFASQAYFPASRRSRFRSVNTCPFFKILFPFGFRSVNGTNGWRLCRRDTAAYSSFVEQFITSFWPKYPFKIACGFLTKASGSVRKKCQLTLFRPGFLWSFQTGGKEGGIPLPYSKSIKNPQDQICQTVNAQYI